MHDAAGQPVNVGLTAQQPVVVILNAGSGAVTNGSGSGRSGEDLVREALQAAGIAASVQIARGAEITSLAGSAIAHGATLVVAGGGDGTVSAVASAVVDSEAALAILPLGTLNHFAKDLHIPLDLAGAVRTLVSGRTIAVDVGEVNARVFVNNASVGVYPTLVRMRDKDTERGRRKWVATARAAVRIWRRYRRVRVRVATDDELRAVRTPFVFVGNNEYQLEGVNIGARARLDAGVLHVAMAPGMTRGEVLRVLLAALIGRLQAADHFESLLTRRLVIDAWRRRLPVALDGEVTMLDTPLRYRTRPRALRVLVPGDSGDTA